MKNTVSLSMIIFLLLIGCSYSETQTMTDPFWTYFVDIYSGQHDVKSPLSTYANVDLTQGTGKRSLLRDNRKFRISRSLLTGGIAKVRNSPYPFIGVPKIIFSLQGVNQNPPADGNTDYGFSCTVHSVTASSFQTTHDIFGADITVLTYMYITI
jgi:hypothetical protein